MYKKQLKRLLLVVTAVLLVSCDQNDDTTVLDESLSKILTEIVVQSNLADRTKKAGNLTNFKDLGELPLQSGRWFKKNKIFRTAYLDNVDKKGKKFLESLGETVLIDLRSDEEIDSNIDFSTVLPKNITRVHLPIPISNALSNGEIIKNVLGIGVKENENYIQEQREIQYKAFVTNTELFEHYKKITKYLLGDKKVILQGEMGKDRIGFLTALLYSSLNAYDKYVIDDYIHANTTLKEVFKDYKDNEVPEIVEMAKNELQATPDFNKLSEEEIDKKIQPLVTSLETSLSVKKEDINLALALIIKEYGSYDVYLKLAFGISQKELEEKLSIKKQG
ncbi:tyrosine-protein phosphatase [Aquimarina hainanensis]|uniref:Tyrosine-protein phosphatase n=1 Tax=Aquimarina hainanensis TaxID=1578017 RepID=A0ABW5NB22_9FLAO